jgi:hypothetical protein
MVIPTCLKVMKQERPPAMGDMIGLVRLDGIDHTPDSGHRGCRSPYSVSVNEVARKKGSPCHDLSALNSKA